MRKQIPRLLIKGGILSPSELKTIAEKAEMAGLDAISFGSRQDILFTDYEGKEKQIREHFKNLHLVEKGASPVENIVSSYVSTDIFPKTSWITGDRYLYILEQFRYNPKLKINITEPKQRLVPVFMGHLNFIASDHEDYWYLYIRLPQWEMMDMYPALIYTWDIHKVSEAIEQILTEDPENVQSIFELVNAIIETNNRTIQKPLEVPFYPFPYYEGINRTGTGEYWLGLYWRNNLYDLKFLKAMCDLCSELKIGRICITPWKSFIIKGIPQSSKMQWEKLLGRFGINVRHSLLELNWHLPVAKPELLKLKRYIVSNFDQNDISTYGLTFSISEHSQSFYYFTSIVIEKNTLPDELKKFEIRDTYNLLYARDFDPNSREYITYAQDVDQMELPSLLMELSQLYFEQLGEKKEEKKSEEAPAEVVSQEAFQCKECLTIYDERYGDATRNIPAGTPFKKLPTDYSCSVCDAPLNSFQKKLVKEVKK